MEETRFSEIKEPVVAMGISSQIPTNKKSVEWVKATIKTYDKNSQLIPTNGFGEIQFTGATRKAKGKFIRLAHDTPADVMYSLMAEHWGLDEPQLLISVTGGAKSFNMDPRLKQQFASGLLKVANTPGAWVLTGGTNTGVMKHVGEALQGVTKACIGLATYGIVTNKSQLLETDTKCFGGRFPYAVASSLVQKGAFLDYNHTHFLLADNGTEGRFGVDIPLRASLEEHLVKKNVPSVLLVLEGGVGTIGTVLGSLRSGVPAVIIKDSGRAADIIGYGLQHFTNEELSVICGDVTNENADLRQEIEKAFPEIKADTRKTEEKIDEEYTKLYCNVVHCFKYNQLIHVFQMGGNADVDEAILTALLNTTNHVRQLNLTLLWDRADLAENKILSQPLADGAKWKDDELHYSMMVALAEDRVDFVRLFLTYGISISKVINQEALEFLYAYRSKESTLRFEVKSSGYTPSKDGLVGMFCRENGVDGEVIPLNKILRLLDDLCSGLRHGSTLLSKTVTVENNPYLHLFFWAVLNNMQKMALYLWEFGEEGCAKALLAASIYEELGNRASKISNLPDEYFTDLKSNAIEFRNLAFDLLDECYRTDEKDTMKLITGESAQFNKFTCLDIAVGSNHMDFVSHSSVQALLNDVWTGSIKNLDITTRDFLLTMLFPPYLLSFDFRTESEMKEMVQVNEEEPATTLSLALPVLTKTPEEDEDNSEQSHIQHTDSNGSQMKLVDSSTSKRSYQATETATSNKPSPYIEKELPFFKKLFLFYFKTPAVKFYLNLVSYVVFLALFSYVAIKKKGKEVSVTEYLVLVYIVSFTIEEIHQLVQAEYSTFQAKIVDYISSKWNVVDLIAIVLYYVGFGLRNSSKTEHVGHLLLALDAGIWILRLLHVFYVHRIMGPYVVMIYRMFVDMMYFLSILFVFMIAYGVCSTAILIPQKRSWKMLIDVIFHPYYNIYGELFIDRDPENAQTTRFGTEVLNDYAEPIGWVMLALYLLVANVLLLNLLIAIFGNTFTEVQDNASTIWRFQRYQLILEYAARPSLIPPFILLTHIYMFLKWLWRCMTCQKSSDNDAGLKYRLSDSEVDQINEFETDCVVSYLRSKRSQANSVSQEDATQDLLERLKNVTKVIVSIENRLKAFEGSNNH